MVHSKTGPAHTQGPLNRVLCTLSRALHTLKRMLYTLKTRSLLFVTRVRMNCVCVASFFRVSACMRVCVGGGGGGCLRRQDQAPKQLPTWAAHSSVLKQPNLHMLTHVCVQTHTHTHTCIHTYKHTHIHALAKTSAHKYK